MQTSQRVLFESLLPHWNFESFHVAVLDQGSVFAWKPVVERLNSKVSHKDLHLNVRNLSQNWFEMRHTVASSSNSCGANNFSKTEILRNYCHFSYPFLYQTTETTFRRQKHYAVVQPTAENHHRNNSSKHLFSLGFSFGFCPSKKT